jgi:hypothetical protein
MRRYAITLDTDWAPDAALDFTADLLAAHQVKATWFVTHKSPAIERLRGRPALFELGIHPNFLPGSSHGATPEAVLDHCMGLVPEARSVRTHALVQSTPLLDLLLRCTPIRCDVTMFLPRAHKLELIDYQWKGERLLRVPYFWEDDVEMLRREPSWDARPLLEHCADLTVFAFHPIHVMLNSADMAPYEALKRAVPALGQASDAQLSAHAHEGLGTRSLLLGLLAHLRGGAHTFRIDDLYQEWRAACA